MGKASKVKYIPDALVTPGDILEEYLEAFQMSQAELSLRTGMAKKTINQIIKGKAPIATPTALKFEKVLGRPAHFWLKLESDFKEDSARLKEAEERTANLNWLQRVPYNNMAKLGWVKNCTDRVERLHETLKFFGVVSADAWKAVWEEHQVAYRQSGKIQRPEAVSAWLRKGELEAAAILCPPFDRDLFLKNLLIARSLTIEPPEVFVPKLTEQCRNSGVALVLVPELPGIRVYGATRWLGTTSKPVIQLNLRGKTNDLFWFTFFHEAGHIVKHGRKLIFLEGNGLSGDKEEEANDFAKEMLIPTSEFNQLGGRRPTLQQIKDFAKRVNIAPGIVVGRLQKEELLPYNIGNGLKVKLKWEGTAG